MASVFDLGSVVVCPRWCDSDGVGRLHQWGVRAHAYNRSGDVVELYVFSGATFLGELRRSG